MGNITYQGPVLSKSAASTIYSLCLKAWTRVLDLANIYLWHMVVFHGCCLELYSACCTSLSCTSLLDTIVVFFFVILYGILQLSSLFYYALALWLNIYKWILLVKWRCVLAFYIWCRFLPVLSLFSVCGS